MPLMEEWDIIPPPRRAAHASLPPWGRRGRDTGRCPGVLQLLASPPAQADGISAGSGASLPGKRGRCRGSHAAPGSLATPRPARAGGGGGLTGGSWWARRQGERGRWWSWSAERDARAQTLHPRVASYSCGVTAPIPPAVRDTSDDRRGFCPSKDRSSPG